MEYFNEAVLRPSPAAPGGNYPLSAPVSCITATMTTETCQNTENMLQKTCLFASHVLKGKGSPSP